MIGVVLLASVLGACIDLQRSGDMDASRDCYVEVINSSENPVEVAGAYAGIGNRKAANDWFRRALETQPDDIAARVEWGRLFASVHQDADAEALYQEALELDPESFAARLALAELYLDRFDGPTAALVTSLLEEQPQAPGPILLKVRMLIEVGDYAAADQLLENLLAVSDQPLAVRLPALSLRSASAQLQGVITADNAWLAEIRALNSDYGEADALGAHFYVITRRYREAVALLEEAVSRDPTLWHAHSELGQNLLRVNRLADARRHLQRAYEGDPYNAITVNTLRLLDTLEGFTTVRDDHLLLRTPQAQSAALAPYVSAFARKTVETMAPRYDYSFERPMVIELFEHHDDFAVRTAGLPGIGILGAAFGDVVVMNGPAAKSFSEGFDWASALWHEMAHVVTLNATDNLVSRWFSEGVSVFEEWRFGPSARHSLPLSFLEAWRDGKLLTVAKLDEGFIRPSYDGQIMVSYVQAGVVCMLIADNYDNGIAKMLEVFRAGGDSQAAITEGLGVSPEVLDELLNDYLDERYQDTAAALKGFRDHASAAEQAAQASDWAVSAGEAEAAIALYPDYVEPGSPYVTAVLALDKTGDLERMTQLAQRYFDSGGRDPRVLELLAEQLSGERALAVQRALALTVPLQIEARAALADGLMAAQRAAEAVGEYEVVLALDPHDRAAAHYQLATALAASGEVVQAQQQVLLALEIAPRYSEALSLLVKLQE